MALRLHDYIVGHHPEIVSDPAAITGWSLAPLARLDRCGARGLVTDLACAGVLTRQAAFVVAAAVDLDAPSAFLARLGIAEDGAAGIGLALRTRRARQIIAAAYGVEPDDVPTGFLRALGKIEEIGAEKVGLDAFEQPRSYRELYEILVGDRHGRRAHALRYASRLRSSTIDAALNLDPVLVHPEIVGVIGTPERIRAANDLMALIRACHTALNERDLVTAMRQSVSSLGVLEAFARRALDTADNLPAPIPAGEGVRPLRTAADYREVGTKLRNCSGSKLTEVALGLLAVVEVTHRDVDGAETVVAVSLTPTIDGRWMISEVGGANNKRPPGPVLRDVLLRMQALGALVPGPARDSSYRTDLANLLGVYRYAPLDDVLHPDGEKDDDEAVMAMLDQISEVA